MADKNMRGMAAKDQQRQVREREASALRNRLGVDVVLIVTGDEASWSANPKVDANALGNFLQEVVGAVCKDVAARRALQHNTDADYQGGF